MICFSPEASSLIQDLISQETDEVKLTLLSAGVGCGAPIIKLELRTPLEDDIVHEMGGTTIRIRQNILRYLENAEIITEETFWGTKLKVKTVFGCK